MFIVRDAIPLFWSLQNSVSGLGRLGRLAKFGLKFKKNTFSAFQNLHIPDFFRTFAPDLGRHPSPPFPFLEA